VVTLLELLNGELAMQALLLIGFEPLNTLFRLMNALEKWLNGESKSAVSDEPSSLFARDSKLWVFLLSFGLDFKKLPAIRRKK